MHRLLTTGEMRRADALAIAAGTPGYTLMLLAGEAVAEAAAQMLWTRGRVLVLCGPGNNGGDGFVAARRLREMGHDVVLALLGNQKRLKGDAARAAGDWTGEVDTVSSVRPADFALVIDALFGAGLARDLDGEAALAVERMNVSGRPILAVDIPSGIDGDTGAVRGTAVRATRTVTFARRKPGHLLLPGRAHCGSVAVADIGIADETIAAAGGSIFANAPALWAEAFPRPTLDTHKYRRGHALVLSGAALHTGAARLAARGALRVGAGLVTRRLAGGGARRECRPAHRGHAAALRRGGGARRGARRPALQRGGARAGARRRHLDPGEGRGGARRGSRGGARCRRADELRGRRGSACAGRGAMRPGAGADAARGRVRSPFQG